MRMHDLALHAALAFAATIAVAQRPAPPAQPQDGDVSLLVASDFADFLSDFTPSSYDALLASVSVEDKAAQVSWAPFLAKAVYTPVLSETRLQVGQKDGQTSLGVVLRWNPLATRSKRGMQAWQDVAVVGFGQETATLRQLRRLTEVHQDTLLSLHDPTIPAKRIQVETTNTALGKVAEGTPLHMALSAQLKTEKIALDAARVAARIAIRTSINTKVAVLQGNFSAAPNQAAKEAIAKEISALLALAPLDGVQLASFQNELDLNEKRVAGKGLASVANYEQALHARPLPIVSLSYTGTLFGAFSGSSIDADNDGLVDNEHRLAARNLTLSATIRLGPANQLSVAGGRSWKRAAAKEGSPQSESDVLGLTYARRLKVLDANYAETEDFLTSLFVPSIVGGVSFERSDCRNDNRDVCPSKAADIVSVSPFIDLKLKKAVQFRIGVNWKKYNDSAIAEEEIGVVSAISLQLGLPN